MPAVDRRPALRVEIPVSLHAAREAGRALRTFLADCALSEEELEAWELAAVEAANNAVNATPAGRRHFPIILEANVSADSVEVRLTDHTDGFELPERAVLPDTDSEHGRGLYLIQVLVDSLDYLQGRGSNCLVLTRKRAEPVPLRPPGQPEQLEAELSLMTEELAASYESLSAIFNFTATLCQAEEPLDLVVPWMKELGRITAADWHAFFILSPDGRALCCASAEGAEIPALIAIDWAQQVDDFLASTAVQSRQDFWFGPQTSVLPGDPLAKAIVGTSGFLHPVFLGATLVGLAAVGRRVAEHPFTAGQVNVIHTFADFLGSQVRYGQVQREITRSEVMLRELEIAASIQRSLLPANLPKSVHLDIAASATSAHEVGGDFYDVIEQEDGGILVVIADVMGKGVPAALFAAILRAVIRGRHDLASHPGQLLEWLNESLFADFDRVDMFATVQLAYFDPDGRVLRAATAGHCPLLVVNPYGNITELGADGLPIGIQPACEYPERTVPIVPGSHTLLYTDGLIEAQNLHAELWGLTHLQAWLRNTAGTLRTAGQIGADLRAELQRFRGTTPVNDDVTFVVLAAH